MRPALCFGSGASVPYAFIEGSDAYREYGKQDSRSVDILPAHFVDVVSLFFDESGCPNVRVFLSRNIHIGAPEDFFVKLDWVLDH